MAISINDNLSVLAPKPIDSRYGPYTGDPDTEAGAIAAANSAIPSFQRHRGLVVALNIGGVISEYWYKDGIQNTDLKLKQENFASFEEVTTDASQQYFVQQSSVKSGNRIVFITTTNTNPLEPITLLLPANYSIPQDAGKKITVYYKSANDFGKKIKVVYSPNISTPPYTFESELSVGDSATFTYGAVINGAAPWVRTEISKNISVAGSENSLPGLITQKDKLKLDAVFPTTFRNDSITMYRWADLSNTAWVSGSGGTLEENNGANISLQERNWLANTATDYALGRAGWVKFDEYFDWDPYQWFGDNPFSATIFVRAGTVSGDGLHLLIRRRKLPENPNTPLGMMQFMSANNMVDFHVSSTNNVYTNTFTGLSANVTNRPQKIGITGAVKVDDNTLRLTTTSGYGGRTIGTNVSFNAGDLITIVGSTDLGVAAKVWTVQAPGANNSSTITISCPDANINVDSFGQPSFMSQFIDSADRPYLYQLTYSYPNINMSSPMWNGPARERWEFWGASYMAGGATPNSAWIGEITVRFKS
jgi:hypothetical protein